jgi:hypothetical protein
MKAVLPELRENNDIRTNNDAEHIQSRNPPAIPPLQGGKARTLRNPSLSRRIPEPPSVPPLQGGKAKTRRAPSLLRRRIPEPPSVPLCIGEEIGTLHAALTE